MGKKYVVLDFTNQKTYGPMTLFRAESKRNEIQSSSRRMAFILLAGDELSPKPRKKSRVLSLNRAMQERRLSYSRLSEEYENE